MHVKSTGMGPELANARSLGSAKFANAPPLGKCHAVAQRGGAWVQLEFTDA